MKKILLIISLVVIISCNNSSHKHNYPKKDNQNLTIFFFNDQHGRIRNFSKIKEIVDIEKRKNKNVIIACAGDLFSGNPIVDQYPDKGYPMIDLMNRIGLDLSVIGNHEFDYGQDILARRIKQANFPFISANTFVLKSPITQPKPYYSVKLDSLKITFLGLTETNGMKTKTIPSTHPWRLRGLEFERPEDIVSKYKNLKEETGSDLYIALTHLGHDGRRNRAMGDFKLAQDFPYFDLIIGGHSHHEIDTVVNKIPVFQCGSNLRFLGKLEIQIENHQIKDYKFEQINLYNYKEKNQEIEKVIKSFENKANTKLKKTIGYATNNHNRDETARFYVEALRKSMGVDFCIQNKGGVRDDLDKGNITPEDIYKIEPFGNGAVTYTMTVGEFEDFLEDSNGRFFIAGFKQNKKGRRVEVLKVGGQKYNDNQKITLGINDYIAAKYPNLLPEVGAISEKTVADLLIEFVQKQKNIDFTK